MPCGASCVLSLSAWELAGYSVSEEAYCCLKIQEAFLSALFVVGVVGLVVFRVLCNRFRVACIDATEKESVSGVLANRGSTFQRKFKVLTFIITNTWATVSIYVSYDSHIGWRYLVPFTAFLAISVLQLVVFTFFVVLLVRQRGKKGRRACGYGTCYFCGHVVWFPLYGIWLSLRELVGVGTGKWNWFKMMEAMDFLFLWTRNIPGLIVVYIALSRLKLLIAAEEPAHINVLFVWTALASFMLSVMSNCWLVLTAMSRPRPENQGHFFWVWDLFTDLYAKEGESERGGGPAAQGPPADVKVPPPVVVDMSRISVS